MFRFSKGFHAVLCALACWQVSTPAYSQATDVLDIPTSRTDKPKDLDSNSGVFQLPLEEIIADVQTNHGYASTVILWSDPQSGKVFAPAIYARELGVPETVPLIALPNGLAFDLAVAYNSEDLSAQLYIEPRYLDSTSLSLADKSLVTELDPIDTASLLRYDMALKKDRTSNIQALGFVSGTVPLAQGILSGTVTLTDKAVTQDRFQVVGLQYEKAVGSSHRILVGEFATKTSQFEPSKRLVGVSLASNGLIRPELNALSVTSVEGVLDATSDVSVFLNGTRLLNEQIQAGRYVLEDIPVGNGLQTLTVLTRDLTGKETFRQIPIGVRKNSYRPGHVDYSLNIGHRYEGYGKFAGGELSAYGELGLTTAVGAVVNVERSDLKSSALLALPSLIGDSVRIAPFFGVVEVPGQLNQGLFAGHQISATTPMGGLTYLDKDYSDPRGLPVSGLLRERALSLSVPIGFNGTVNLTSGYQDRAGLDRIAITGLFASKSFGEGNRLSLGVTRIDDQMTFNVSLSLPLERYKTSSSYIKSGDSETVGLTAVAPYSDTSPYGSMTASKALDPIGTDSLNVRAEKNMGEYRAYSDIFYSDQDFELRIGAQGAAAFDTRSKRFYMTDAFTDSQVLVPNLDKGAVIYVNGRELAPSTSDYRLVPVAPFVLQNIAIDPGSLAPETELEEFTYPVKVRNKGMSVLNLKRPLPGREIVVIGTDGKPLPEGSLIYSDKQESVIGEGGRAFIRFTPGTRVVVNVPKSDDCELLISDLVEYACIAAPGLKLSN